MKNAVRCALAALLFAAGLARPALVTPANAAVRTPEAALSSFSGGQTVAFDGLPISASAKTNLGFVNQTAATNHCSLAFASSQGVELESPIRITLRPHEELPFVDVFERMVDPSGVGVAKATVSCEGAFSTFAMRSDAAGRSEAVAPELASKALPPVVPKADCPAGATCFDAPGVVHIPEPPPGAPVGRVAFPAPAGVTTRMRLTMSVDMGQWNADEPSGKHLIYWFVVTKNKDMPGLLYFLGPNKNEAFARHGMGLTHPQKIKIIKHFEAQPGHSYYIDNDYDMAGKRYTIKITDVTTGLPAITLTGRPNVTQFTIKPPETKFFVDMGFYPGKVPGEVTSYGWVYHDVHVETYMKH